MIDDQVGDNNNPTIHQPVYIADADIVSLQHHHQHRHSTASHNFELRCNNFEVGSIWDDERGIVALKEYYALRYDGQTTVSESCGVWSDTLFTLFAIQCGWLFASFF